MTKHEEALRRIARRFVGRESSVAYDRWFAGLREAFALGWNAGAEAQREADAKEWESRSGLYNADAVYRLILDVPLVTLDDAKELVK